MTWYTSAIVSALCFSFYGLLGRVLVIRSDQPKVFAAVYNFLAGLFALAFLLVDKPQWKPIPWPIVALTVLMIFVYGIFNRTEYIAKKYMEASLFAIVAKLATIYTFLLSILFLGEGVTPNKFLAALFILGANVLVFYRHGNFQMSKGLKYALVMSVFLGAGWTIDKVATPYWPLPIYAFMSYALANVFVIFFPTISLSTLTKEFKRTNWKVALLAAVSTSGYYFLIKAFTLGEASRVILINATNSLITIFLAILILKERKNIVVKIFAGFLAFIGVILLK